MRSTPFGHTRIENMVRYLGIDIDDALEISEQLGRADGSRAARRFLPTHVRFSGRFRELSGRRNDMAKPTFLTLFDRRCRAAAPVRAVDDRRLDL
jgi:hypothetical protein